MRKSLKPCLHCGEDSGQITVLNGIIIAKCDNCRVIIIGEDLTEDGAIDAWNRKPEGEERQGSPLPNWPMPVGEYVGDYRIITADAEDMTVTLKYNGCATEDDELRMSEKVRGLRYGTINIDR